MTMKLGTIGSGNIVDQMFQSIEGIDGIEPVAVYSRTQEKADEFAKKHHVDKAYDSMEAFLADPEMNTVYIASPNSLHVPQAKAALEAGKNVILEKPFAATVEEAQSLFELAEKNGKMIFEAITSVHTPNFGLMKDQMERIGTVREGILNFSQYSSKYNKFRHGEVTNTFDPAMQGGALMDINIYNIHLAVNLFGLPKEVIYYPVFGDNGIDTSGVLVLVYPNRVITCIGSKDSSSDYLGFIQGEDGTFKISEGSTGKIAKVEFQPTRKENQVVEEEVISIDQGLHMTYEFMDFLTALEENNQEMYQACKKQTLDAMDVLEKAASQRDAKAAEYLKTA